MDEALTLWASWKREHSNPDLLSEHLEKGGFRLTAEIAEKGRNVNNALKIFTMTAEDFKTLDGLLTTEQKGYADALVKYMSTDLSAMGNEVTMRLFDSKLFKDDYYIPFKTDPNSRPRQQDAGSVTVDEVAKITHPGFAKARLAGSNNALTINGITEVTAAHTQQMLNYVTMAEPVQDLNKVLNWKRPPVVGEDGERLEVQPLSPRVRTMFMTKYGSTAEKYLAGFQKDLAGGAGQDMQESQLNKLVSMFKRGAVFGNMSVVAKQPFSYIRAAAVMNPKYLTAGLVQGKNHGTYDELMKYSGVAVIKQMGTFDMGFGQGGTQYLMDDDVKAWAKLRKGKAVEAINDTLGSLPGAADLMTWTKLWHAVKAEQADGYEGDTKSEEFLQKCGERFNEVMDLTQIYDSVLTRSANMRSKGGLMKMATAFRAEPTLTANMLYDALAHGDAKAKARAASVYVVSGIVMAMVSTFFSSIRKKKEDGKTLWEEMMSGLHSNLLSELLPVNLLPVVSDLYGIFLEGQDVERSDMSMFKQLSDSLTKMFRGDYKDNIMLGVEEVGGQVAQMLGLPAKNVLRDVRAAMRLTKLISE